jgi:hypothetical protein
VASGDKPTVVRNFVEFLDAIRGLGPARRLFRGVCDARFELIPSIGHARNPNARPFTRSDEKKLLDRFKDQVRRFVGAEPQNDLEWLVLGQHHGLPTRLLDWTLSPIVAAFFAVEDTKTDLVAGRTGAQVREIPGKVYTAPLPREVSSRERIDPFTVKAPKLVLPSHISSRIPQQSSVLTLHPSPNRPWQPRKLRVIEIPPERKLEFKRELDVLGINEATLFPGIDAVAKYFAWQFRFDSVL